MREYRVLSEYVGFGWIVNRYDVHLGSSIEAAVDLLLEHGWRCQGGIGCISTKSRAYLIQAMVLEENE